MFKLEYFWKDGTKAGEETYDTLELLLDSFQEVQDEDYVAGEKIVITILENKHE